MLHVLLKHSVEPYKASSSAAQSITILIDHIHDPVQKLKFEDLLKSDQFSTIVNNLDNGVEQFAGSWVKSQFDAVKERGRMFFMGVYLVIFYLDRCDLKMESRDS